MAEKIQKRGGSYVAGDDNPYNRHKRRKFLQTFLDRMNFDDLVVLEVGCGPGGNLHRIITQHAPSRLLGVDVSQKMFELAGSNLSSFNKVELKKTDGTVIPFPDQSVDLAFTVTVLQHVSDERMFRSLISEMCRVTRGTIILMEDIGSTGEIQGEGSFVGRKIAVYRDALAQHGFELQKFRFLNTRVSRALYQRAYYWHQRLTTRKRQEGESAPLPVWLCSAAAMPITRILDNVVPERFDLAQMEFRRTGTT